MTNVLALHAEAAGIAARRPDSIRDHPAQGSQLAQVERQQALGSLIAALADGRLDFCDDRDLPLIVDCLLRNAPQSTSAPAVVAKSVQEAADDTDDAVVIVAQLAAGTAHTATYGYLMYGAQQLCDWLSTAGAR